MGLHDIKPKFMKLNIQQFATNKEITITENSWNAQTNTSNVTVTYRLWRTGSSTTHWENEKTGTFTIDGANYTFKLKWPSSKTSVSISKTLDISHNSDGSKTLYASAKIPVSGVNGSPFETSTSKILSNIPRYANITEFSISNLNGFDGLTKLKINYSTDANIDWKWYSINGGEWITFFNDDIIHNLSPETTYDIRIRVRRTDSQLTTDSWSIRASTKAVCKIISGTPNITNGQSLKVIASNDSGASCDIKLEVPAGTVRLQKTGTDVTFTAEEINSLMQYITGTTSSVRVTATTYKDLEYFFHWKDGTYSIVNSNPIFESFSFEDINEKTLALTGNNQDCIIGHSNIQAVVPVLTKAHAQNYATMSKYRLTIGGDSVDQNFKETEDVFLMLNRVKTGNFTIFAIDSRGFSTAVTKLANNVINYTNLLNNNNTIASRVNENGEAVGFSEKVKVSFTAQMWKGNFGVKENSIISLKYRYKISSNSDWREWIPLDTNAVQIDDTGKITFNSLLKGDTDEGFDISNAYNCEILIEDELSSCIFKTNIASGIPHLCWDKKGLGIMGKYDVNKGGLLQVGSEPILMGKDILMASFDSPLFLTEGWNPVPFNVSRIIGDKLTLLDGKIQIGKGVSYIKVSSTFFVDRIMDVTYIWAQINKNNSKIADTIISGSNYHLSGNITDVFIPVNEGDNIAMGFDNPSYETSKNTSVREGFENTWLYVEVIK